jgi:outer membrane protein assembly factor BamB
MISIARICLWASLAAAFVEQPTFADDWPHWRGPTRNDLSVESSRWDFGGWKDLKPLWTAETGEGSSSPVVFRGFVYTLGHRDGNDVLECRDVANGNIAWRQEWPAKRYGRKATGDEGIYSGPCSTPEIDPDKNRIFTLGSDGELRAGDLGRRGELLWHKSLYDEFDIPQRPRVGRSGLRDYGFTSSPLAYGDWVIVEAGAESGTLAGFEAATGKLVWQSEADTPAGHTGGPVPITVEGVPCVLVHAFEGLVVTRLDPPHVGETVATYPWKTDFANNIATPAVEGDSVVLTSHYNQHKIARLRISLPGAELVWEQPVASKVCSPVIADGRVYVAWHEVYCLDFETGEVQWHGGRVGDPGSLIATHDDRLIVWSQRGTLSLVEQAGRSPRQFTELASRPILRETDAWPHIVLSDGLLFAKDRGGNLACLSIGK